MSGGLRERLGRLTGSGGERSLTQEQRQQDQARHAAEPEAEAWLQLGFELRLGSGGSCFARDIRYGSDHKHGLFTVSELHRAGAALSKLDPAGRMIAPERLLFLDTETTGLGQGAGNVPFLIGLGWWSREGFTVRQYVIRHPGEEAAMLANLSEQLPDFTHLVTYNGRSFDWPLVKNRYVLHRLPPPKDPAHFDFLYPSRSLWRTTMPSCRLGAVEEAKLGVLRIDDVPGAQAPALYFQYLAERDVTLLSGVFRHNELDILTLLTLAIHFGRMLDGDVAYAALSSAELLRLGLWYEKLGFEHQAAEAMESLAARPADECYEELGQAAQFYKRRKMWQEAARLWHLLADNGNGRLLPSLEPYIELAMVYEHRLKNREAALFWTNEALRGTELRLSLSRFGQDAKLRELLADLNKRKNRLLKKSSF